MSHRRYAWAGLFTHRRLRPTSLDSVPVLALCYLIHVATESLTDSYLLLLPEYNPRKFTAEYNNNFIIVFGTLATILQVLLWHLSWYFMSPCLRVDIYSSCNLGFRKTGRHIAALTLEQMCRLFYLKRAIILGGTGKCNRDWVSCAMW